MTKKSEKNDLYKTVEMFDGGQKFELQYEFVEVARLRAKECGQSLPGLFKRCLEVGVGFKPETWQGLTTLADLYGMSESQIVNVMVKGELDHLEKERIQKIVAHLEWAGGNLDVLDPEDRELYENHMQTLQDAMRKPKRERKPGARMATREEE